MPEGSRGEKHPVDVIGNAVHVMRIATSAADLAKLIEVANRTGVTVNV